MLLSVDTIWSVWFGFFLDRGAGSLKLYHDHFYCFGCGEHGDVIKLTGKLLGLSPIDSARRLADDFNVIIHDDFNPREQTRINDSPQKIVTYN